jgi:aminoglycoside phosphotransferase (APT) family kinase protein
MIARYAERTGRSVDHLPWFEVLACYKLGLILEGSHARAQAGLADLATGQRLHRSAVALLEEAQAIITRS